MEISPLVLIVGGLAAMFFGYFFGLVEGRGQGRKKGKSEAAEEYRKEMLEHSVPPPPTTAPQPEDLGLLYVKEEGGMLLLDLDGTRLPPQGISMEQRRRLIELVTRMRPWIDGRPASVSTAPPASPAVTPSPRPATPAAEPVSSVVSAAAQGDEPPAALSMVGQINEILQKNIAGTALAERGIRLQDAPGGGVIVIAGFQRFASIGDVSDPDVQAALRTAVAMWEKKYTPGA